MQLQLKANRIKASKAKHVIKWAHFGIHRDFLLTECNYERS